MSPSVDLFEISFAYAERQILQKITFSIVAGEFIGIIGPNGGGKTTLLKLLMGFLKPSSGTIKILNTQPKQARTHIAWVPQNLRFDRQFPISLLELVLSGRLSKAPKFFGYSKDDKLAALAALEQVGLKEMKDHAFADLSGGQIQRALIARALASAPEILLLDEPTANVDVQAESQIYSILHGLKGKMTILMVTHDLKAIVNQVDKVLCLQNTASLLKPEQVCGHFALNLYHTPFIPN